MSIYLNPFKTGLVLAMVPAGFIYAGRCWLRSDGHSRSINFVFWAHFIKPVYVIEPFQFARAIALLVLTASTGFILGLVFGWVWNALYRSAKQSG